MKVLHFWIIALLRWPLSLAHFEELLWSQYYHDNQRSFVYRMRGDPAVWVRILTTGGAFPHLPHLAMDHQISGAVAGDYARRTVFWHDRHGQRGGSVHLTSLTDTAQSRILFTASTQVRDLAVDWVNQNIYWTDAASSIVAMATYRDSQSDWRVVHSDQEGVWGVEIDPATGLLFWSAGNTLRRSGATGSDVQDVYHSDTSTLLAITLDRVSRSVFWVVGLDQAIMASGFDGGLVRVVWKAASNKNLPIAGIAIHQEYLFFAPESESEIHVVNVTSGAVVSEFFYSDYVGRVTQSGLTLLSEATQPPAQSLCDDDNGGCEHLCVLGGPPVQCACARGYELSSDGVSCSPGVWEEDNFVILADAASLSIHQVSLASGERVRTLPVALVTSPRSLQYDPLSRRVYWSNPDSKVIQRSRVDGSGLETMATMEPGSRLEGIAIDVRNRKLYYADLNGRIVRLELDSGAQDKVLSLPDPHRPSDLALDPENRMIYWTNVQFKASITRSPISGVTAVETLVSEDLGYPRALTLDLKGGEMFWCDVLHYRIERARLGGDHRTVVHGAPFVSAVALAYVHGSLLFSSPDRRGLRNLSLSSGSVSGFASNLFGPVSAVVVYISPQTPYVYTTESRLETPSVNKAFVTTTETYLANVSTEEVGPRGVGGTESIVLMAVGGTGIGVVFIVTLTLLLLRRRRLQSEAAKSQELRERYLAEIQRPRAGEPSAASLTPNSR